jgi:hypothetical protein
MITRLVGARQIVNVQIKTICTSGRAVYPRCPIRLDTEVEGQTALTPGLLNDIFGIQNITTSNLKVKQSLLSTMPR